MLRDFQQGVQNESFEAWRGGAVAIMITMATGGGKTVTYTDTAVQFDCPTVAISHRQELVSQSALAFNREHVPHSVIAPKEVIKQIIALEHETHGYSCFAARAAVRVAGVDTLRNHD